MFVFYANWVQNFESTENIRVNKIYKIYYRAMCSKLKGSFIPLVHYIKKEKKNYDLLCLVLANLSFGPLKLSFKTHYAAIGVSIMFESLAINNGRTFFLSPKQKNLEFTFEVKIKSGIFVSLLKEIIIVSLVRFLKRNKI